MRVLGYRASIIWSHSETGEKALVKHSKLQTDKPAATQMKTDCYISYIMMGPHLHQAFFSRKVLRHLEEASLGIDGCRTILAQSSTTTLCPVLSVTTISYYDISEPILALSRM
jgi:hypothetical protein